MCPAFKISPRNPSSFQGVKCGYAWKEADGSGSSMKGYCRHFERGLGAAEAKEENIIVLVGRMWKAARR